MITGFNTDIQFEGVTYHVQTEDKGIKTPLILSLVYVGGTIIASKRTPYQDLVEKGFDEQALTERLQRQHKLICAAIRAGRIADLKKMSGEGAARTEAEAAGRAGRARAETAAPSKGAQSSDKAADEAARPDAARAAAPRRTESPPAARTPAPEPAAGAETKAPVTKTSETKTAEQEAAESSSAAAATEVADELMDFYDGNIAVLEPLYLSLLDDEGDFRAGQMATLKIHVGRGGYGHQSNVAGATVTIKVLGTSFRPLLLSTTTDSAGVAMVRALLPRFTSGRAAIIIRAASDGEATELRRIIHHS